MPAFFVDEQREAGRRHLPRYVGNGFGVLGGMECGGAIERVACKRIDRATGNNFVAAGGRCNDDTCAGLGQHVGDITGNRINFDAVKVGCGLDGVTHAVNGPTRKGEKRQQLNVFIFVGVGKVFFVGAP